MTAFRMPSLGADMEAGTLVEWLKHPGDAVARGDVIAVVETQKGAIEIEVFEDGQVEQLLVEPGTTVPVGTELATIVGLAGTEPAAEMPEVATAAVAPPPSAAPPPRPAAAAKLLPSGFSPSADRGRVKASPAARRLAAERGLALETLAGSGPGGAILFKDVRAVKPAVTSTAAPESKARKGLDMVEMRAAIAAAMARAKREIPHYYLAHEVDLAVSQRWLTDSNANRPPAKRLLMGCLFLKAAAKALAKFKEFNGFYQDGGFVAAERIHTGLAVAIRGGGLIAPAIHDADRLSLDELMEAMRDIIQRVRSGMLRSSELSDPTVTVSSLGERGVQSLFPVIYPPQVAIIGFGTVIERPMSTDGQIAVHPTVTATLAADHRVSDGHRGALLLREIDRNLQSPEAL